MAIQTKDRIKELLGTGLSETIVASTMGLTPAYISQLLSDEDFHNEVIELRSRNLAAHTVRDRSLDGIEDKLIAKLEDMVDTNQIYKPQDIARLFQLINGAKRRGVSAPEAVVVNNSVVTLSIAKSVSLSYQTNKHNEVVEVAGKTMVTMQAQSLLATLASTRAKAGETNKYEAARRYLPQAGSTQEQLDLAAKRLSGEAAEEDPVSEKPRSGRNTTVAAVLQRQQEARARQDKFYGTGD